MNRESPMVRTHAGLRRLRKGLLSDLSSLVKISKQLQEVLQDQELAEKTCELLDDMVLKAFRVITRAVRFLDIWLQDAPPEISLDLISVKNRPPTPPVEAARDAESVAVVSQSSPAEQQPMQTSSGSPDSRVLDTHAQISDNGARQSAHHAPRLLSAQGKRMSLTLRSSYTGKVIGSRKRNLASQRLDAAHDSFIGSIGSFVGLHLQSRLSSELLHATQQSVIACQQLLTVVEEVWQRDCRCSEPLQQARNAMYARLAEFVNATRDALDPLGVLDGEDVMWPDQGRQLVAAATSCVRSAGDCVTRARSVIEGIGDFEIDDAGLAAPDADFEDVVTSSVTDFYTADHRASTSADSKPLPAPPEPTSQPPPLPLSTKPLPDPPASSPWIESGSDFSGSESPLTDPNSIPDSSLPAPLEALIPHSTHPRRTTSLDPTRSLDNATAAFWVDGMNVSSADSSSTYPGSIHGDQASIVSQTSTRATSPDRSPVTQREPSMLLSSFGSISELQHMTGDDYSPVEEQMLGKTYAHELLYNKEGLISGGSLPALVEKLTTHESTPDAMFVTTFYLTFRLFTTPKEFARCLVDRFEYVGDSHAVGIPVRLRVYNIFKGWLESHWRCDSDAAALGIITRFAEDDLRSVLPAAGQRLVELIARVSEVRGQTLVPRHISSLGKTNTSIAVFSAPDNQIPNPIISKSQLNALRRAQKGGPPCSIIDFDPLELARQFTIIESGIFCSIQPEELLASEWTKKVDSKAVNVRAMSTLSTHLANLVADTILQLDDPKMRAAVIRQWIKTAAKCSELNNYDSLMAIICSLNSSMVTRLKRTWDMVPQKMKTRLDELKSIVDVGKNYAVLRQQLQDHVGPCIPFVGLYLTDLTFIDVGNQTTRLLPEGASVINFDKHMRTAKIISQLQRFQAPYRLTAVPEMQDWMRAQIARVQTSEQTSVQSYYRRSLLLEPRDPRDSAKERFDLWGSLHVGSKSALKEKLHAS